MFRIITDCGRVTTLCQNPHVTQKPLHVVVENFFAHNLLTIILAWCNQYFVSSVTKNTIYSLQQKTTQGN